MKKVVKVFLAFTLVLLLGFVCACGASYADDYSYTNSGTKTNISYSKVTDVDNSGIVEEGKKIIYTAKYRIYSKDISEVIAQVKTKLKEIGGYISDNEEEPGSYANYEYRVPVAKYEEFLDFLDAIDGVASKSLSSEDVTVKYNQYEAKIEALEMAKASFESLLQKEGITVNEITSIYKEIQEINAELLEYNNLLEVLSNSIDYTFVNVSYRETVTGEETPIKDFFQEYGEYFVNFFVIVIKVILYLIPAALIAGVVLLIIFKPFKKMKAKKMAKVDKTE